MEASPQDETIIDYDADNESGDELNAMVVAAQGAQPSVDTGAIGTMHILNGELNQAVAETSDEVLEEQVPRSNFPSEAIINEVEAVQVKAPVEPHGVFSIVRYHIIILCFARGAIIMLYLLLEYFSGEKPLRRSQISRNIDPVRSAFWQILCVFTSTNLVLQFYCCELINPPKDRICLMLAKHSSNTLIIDVYVHVYR